eukprot:COSAG01_NODE_14810_length_1407_cov_1.334098_2_plen_90_part_00
MQEDARPKVRRRPGGPGAGPPSPIPTHGERAGWGQLSPARSSRFAHVSVTRPERRPTTSLLAPTPRAPNARRARVAPVAQSSEGPKMMG